MNEHIERTITRVLTAAIGVSLAFNSFLVTDKIEKMTNGIEKMTVSVQALEVSVAVGDSRISNIEGTLVDQSKYNQLMWGDIKRIDRLLHQVRERTEKIYEGRKKAP